VWIGGELGLPASTVGRVLRRHRVPLLRDLDRLTGAPIRVRASGLRYERDRPGELIHVDVKKLGKIPDGGGWRVHGRSEAVRGRGIGYDYVHSAVDDHSRAAYSEVLPDEKGVTCAGFLLRAGAWFTGHGVRVERVMTDNAMAYRHSGAWRDAMAVLGARQVFSRPHCPWTNCEGVSVLLRVGAYLDWFLTAGTHQGRGIDPVVRDAFVDAYTGTEALRAGFEYYRAGPTNSQQISAAVTDHRLTVPTMAVGAHPVGDSLYRQLLPVTDDLIGHLLNDCGHLIPLDRPDALLDLLVPFLT